MLRVEDLHVAVGGKTILRGVNLHIKPGETHVPVSYTHLDVYKRQQHTS